MARVPRSFLADGVYHVTGRGVDGCGIYRDEDDRRYFLRLVLDAVRRSGWSLHALCLMGNHLHLVFWSTREALSAGMHAVNGRHAQRFNLRYGRTCHLFGDRFGRISAATSRRTPFEPASASSPAGGRGAGAATAKLVHSYGSLWQL